MPGISLEKSLCEKKRRGNQKGSEGGPTSKQVSLGVKDRGKSGCVKASQTVVQCKEGLARLPGSSALTGVCLQEPACRHAPAALGSVASAAVDGRSPQQEATLPVARGLCGSFSPASPKRWTLT